MFGTDDTIAAIATPAGRGALGVVRISGPSARQIAEALIGGVPLRPRHATLVRVRPRAGAGHAVADDLSGAVQDQAIATFYPRPASYTGDDLVELSLHGGSAVLHGVLAAAVRRGARLAEPGEFTLRAFLAGKLDLIQAEAVADLVDAVTPLQARAAFDQLDGTLTAAIAAIEAELFDVIARLEASLDFPEEGYRFVEPSDVALAVAAIRDRVAALLATAARGRLVREGATVALAGVPNVGKSSLFNALLNSNRAIVTPVPGTTRDLISERVEMRGVVLRLVDTAGLRESDDEAEREGVARSRGAVGVAELVLIVLDASVPLTGDDRTLLREAALPSRLVVVNKIDLPAAWRVEQELAEIPFVAVSAHDGRGVDELVERIVTRLGGGSAAGDVPAVTNLRHADLLEQCRATLSRSLAAMAASAAPVPEELLLADLQEASGFLQEVVGRRTTDDLLRHIFTRFCIGK